LIDAGAFGLSKDRGPVHLWDEASYGIIVGHPEAIVSAISQEVAIYTFLIFSPSFHGFTFLL
jgi:hypothetical protein